MVPKKPLFGKISLNMLALPAIVALVGLSAFGLGRLSALEGQKQLQNEVLVYQGSHIATTTPVQ